MTLGVRRVGMAVLALAVALVTARLGLWQLDRAREKTALEARVVRRGALPPLAPAELARDTTTAPGQLQRRVSLHGRWIAGASVYLDNHTLDGKAGFLVLTPLLLGDGDAVLVQRGWMPRDAADPTRLAPLATPAGAVQVVGRVAPPPARRIELGAAGGGAIRQNLDLEQFSREIRVPLRAVTVQQLDAPGTAADGLLRRWSAPMSGITTNRGYAAQWFALSALTIVLYVWFELIAPRRLPRSRPAG